MTLRKFDGARARNGVDFFEAHPSIKETAADRADPDQVAGDERQRDVIEHALGRLSGLTAPQAVDGPGSTRALGLLPSFQKVQLEVAAGDEVRALRGHDRKSRLDPIPHGLFVHAKKPRRLVERVRATALDAPRICPAGAHVLLSNAVFDELTDVFNAPSRNAPAELYGFWIAAILDPGPPSGLANGDRTARREDRRETKKAGLREFAGV